MLSRSELCGNTQAVLGWLCGFWFVEPKWNELKVMLQEENKNAAPEKHHKQVD